MVGAPIFLFAKDSGLAVVNSKSLHSTHSKPPVSSSADSKTSVSSEIYSKTIVGLYSALQHEALITDCKTKINESFVRKVAKKYYPNLMKTIDNIGASDYGRTRLAEIEEANKLIKKDISKQSDIEHERTISKISHPIRIC